MHLQEVTFGYVPNRPVISAVSSTMVAGRFCALVGPNASGKSTLLRLMMGHHVPWTGDVCLDGVSVRRHTTRQRARRISYVPPHGAAAFSYTVAEVVRMGLHVQGEDRQVMDAALGVCAVRDLRHCVFNQLSSGQQQRVMLARAVAQATSGGRFMLLDEPVSAMDVGHAHAAMELLRRMTSGGLGVLAVLHDIGLAARYADDVWLMNEGRIVASGFWDNVLTTERLQHVYGIRLEQIRAGANRRPMFYADFPDTMPP